MKITSEVRNTLLSATSVGLACVLARCDEAEPVLLTVKQDVKLEFYIPTESGFPNRVVFNLFKFTISDLWALISDHQGKPLFNLVSVDSDYVLVSYPDVESKKKEVQSNDSESQEAE